MAKANRLIQTLRGRRRDMFADYPWTYGATPLGESPAYMDDEDEMETGGPAPGLENVPYSLRDALRAGFGLEPVSTRSERLMGSDWEARNVAARRRAQANQLALLRGLPRAAQAEIATTMGLPSEAERSAALGLKPMEEVAPSWLPPGDFSPRQVRAMANLRGGIPMFEGHPDPGGLRAQAAAAQEERHRKITGRTEALWAQEERRVANRERLNALLATLRETTPEVRQPGLAPRTVAEEAASLRPDQIRRLVEPIVSEQQREQRARIAASPGYQRAQQNRAERLARARENLARMGASRRIARDLRMGRPAFVPLPDNPLLAAMMEGDPELALGMMQLQQQGQQSAAQMAFGREQMQFGARQARDVAELEAKSRERVAEIGKALPAMTPEGEVQFEAAINKETPGFGTYMVAMNKMRQGAPWHTVPGMFVYGVGQDAVVTHRSLAQAFDAAMNPRDEKGKMKTPLSPEAAAQSLTQRGWPAPDVYAYRRAVQSMAHDPSAAVPTPPTQPRGLGGFWAR